MTRDNVLQQEVKEYLHFWVLEALNLGDELAVQEETFLSRDWVYANQRVDGIYRVLPDQTPRYPYMCNHHRRTVNSLQAVQKGSEGW
jgi:hypothetical protein